MGLKLEDLKHSEAHFTLSTKPGKQLTLRAFSLADKIWARQRFGEAEKINDLFSKQDMIAICELAHHLLVDKTEFPTFMDFAQMVQGPLDESAIYKALLETIGLSQPVIKKIAQEANAPEKKPKPLKK